jgi:hypothetical protein
MATSRGYYSPPRVALAVVVTPAQALLEERAAKVVGGLVAVAVAVQTVPVQ